MPHVNVVDLRLQCPNTDRIEPEKKELPSIVLERRHLSGLGSNETPRNKVGIVEHANHGGEMQRNDEVSARQRKKQRRVQYWVDLSEAHARRLPTNTSLQTSSLCGLRFGAVAAASAGHSTSGRANDPRSEPLEGHEQFAVSANYRFALAAGDGAKHLTARFVGGHHQPVRNGVLGAGVERSPIVNAPNIAGNKAGADERDLDAAQA